MPVQIVNVNCAIDWHRPKNSDGAPYKWGDRKNRRVDMMWSITNVIYRWVKNSSGEIAEVGETNRTVSERVNNYISASPTGKAGGTNKKVYEEQQALQMKGDYLYLEFTDKVPTYNLSNNRERKLAEMLLIACIRPYLQ